MFEDDYDPIQVGEEAPNSHPVIKSEDCLMSDAMLLGLNYGTLPFTPMTTDKGRSVKFPYPCARPNQLDCVEAICSSLENGNNVLFEAGTGSGKSGVALSVAANFESSWLLVGRNDLIDQWESDFKNYADIGFYKARGRFTCVNSNFDENGRQRTCGENKELCKNQGKKIKADYEAWVKGGSVGQPPRKPLPCPYGTNRDITLGKPHTAMTLALGLTVFNHLRDHPMVTQREVMVIDECSELESELMKFHKCEISTKTIKKVVPMGTTIGDIPELSGSEHDHIGVLDEIRSGKPKDLASALIWTEFVKKILKYQITKIGQPSRQMQNADEKDAEWIKKENDKLKEEVGNVLRQIESMENAMRSNVPYFFEVKEDINFRTKQKTEDWKVSLSPLDARGLFEVMLGKFAKRFLFVSATTGPSKHFKATHDLKFNLQQISLPSPFPPENRPVFSLRSGNMSFKTIDNDLPKMLNDIVKIVSATGNGSQNHAKQNGVIHTYNNKVMNAVIEKLYQSGLGNRIIELQGSGNQREAALQMFKEGKGKILVSPSAMLGLSFIDDMARYQIIAKVPYPSLADPSVKYRMENIEGWYEWQVAKDLIQTFGRVCRSLTDWGVTYILDSKFQDFYKANKRLFPDYVQKAIQVR